MKILYSLFILLILVFSCKKVEKTCDEALVDCSTLTSYSIDSSKINRKVIVVGVDGVRSDGIQPSITPFMDSLSKSANSFFNAEHQVEDHTWSGPNWSSICTGVHWCKHGVTDNDFSGKDYDTYPHFFDYLETYFPDINSASVVHWLPINKRIINQCDYCPESSVNDEEVHQAALQLLRDGNPIDADVLFLHYDDIDHEGHFHGFDPEKEAYRSALTQMDDYLSALFVEIESKRNQGQQVLLIVVSDHGGCGRGHGGGQDIPEIANTILLLNDPSVNFRSTIESNQADIVPSILDYLGISSASFDCKTDGISLILN